jgi:hypothetical protein
MKDYGRHVMKDDQEIVILYIHVMKNLQLLKEEVRLTHTKRHPVLG